MVSIAVHIIFYWVLSLTMQAQTAKELPAQPPEIKEDKDLQEILPSSFPVQPTTPSVGSRQTS